MWLEDPRKTRTVGTLALIFGGALIATGVVVLNLLLGGV